MILNRDPTAIERIPIKIPHVCTRLAKIKSLDFNGGLKNCEAQGNCPGFAGYGAYLYIPDMPDANAFRTEHTLRLTNKYNGNVYIHGSDQYAAPNAADCEDGDEQIEYGTIDSIQMNYCSPRNNNMTKGKPGAVIIVW